jgi:hypothetical protein
VKHLNLAETTPHLRIIDGIKFRKEAKPNCIKFSFCVFSLKIKLKVNWEQESPAESVPDSKRCGDIPKRVKEYLF